METEQKGDTRDFRILTPLSLAECAAALRLAIEREQAPGRNSWFISWKEEVDGEVSGSEVRLILASGGSNGFSTRFSGRFGEAPGGTQLEGRFHPTWAGLLPVWAVRAFGLMVVGTMAGSSIYGIFRPFPPFGEGIALQLFLLGFCLFWMTMMWLFTEDLTRGHRDRLAAFIRSATETA